jgi:hypothetical protein
MRVELAASALDAGGSSDVLVVPKPPRVATSRDSAGNQQVPFRSELPQENPRLPEPPQRSLSIRMDEDKRILYQIIDQKTGEVVRQVPPEEVRRAAHNIAELVRVSEARRKHQIEIDT